MPPARKANRYLSATSTLVRLHSSVATDRSSTIAHNANDGSNASRRGDIANLKPSYRVRLARYGFVLEHTKLAVFKPEA